MLRMPTSTAFGRPSRCIRPTVSPNAAVSLAYLTYKGVFLDAGRLAGPVADGLREEVLNAYPKPADGPYILDAIIAHANRSPAAAPPGSLAAHLLLRHLTEDAE